MELGMELIVSCGGDEVVLLSSELVREEMVNRRVEGLDRLLRRHGRDDHVE